VKKILVISGKGGTGKTFFTASLACLAGEKKIMVDCDVDAANLYLLLHPEIKKSAVFRGGYQAELDRDKCIQCGKCLTICRFEAIKAMKDKKGRLAEITIDPFSCEGCGACRYGCPADAIRLEKEESGRWFVADTRYGPFVFAKLGIAAENSGKLVAKIKEEADKLGAERQAEYIIIDGPPGIGCPVIASMSGVDLALVVTEPTLSGISDMLRVMEVARFFEVETKVVINKHDLNLENSRKIESMCAEKGIAITGRIPFSPKVDRSIVGAAPYIEFFGDDKISKKIKDIWSRIS
jgi:MinD superfamily P-loop ATPase